MDPLRREQFVRNLARQHGESADTLRCINVLASIIERECTSFKLGQVALALQMITDDLYCKMELGRSRLEI